MNAPPLPLPDPRWRVDTIFEAGQASSSGALKTSPGALPAPSSGALVLPATASGFLSAVLVRAMSPWLPDSLTGAQQPAGALEGVGGVDRPPSPEGGDVGVDSLVGGSLAGGSGNGIEDAPLTPPLAKSDRSGSHMYKRSAEVTSVSRIGRREGSVLRVRARTFSDRDAGMGADGADAKALRERILAATAAAADPLFDFAPYRSVNLAGMGAVPSFHFIAAAAVEVNGVVGGIEGPNLSGIAAVAPLPAPPIV